EDDRAVRKVTRHVLEHYGYRVLDVPCGSAALEAWSSDMQEIELLLTDMIMPDGMTGLELAQRLCSERDDLKVIFTSGYRAEAVGQDLLLREKVNFLPKPSHPAKLARLVRDCLDEKKDQAQTQD